MLDDNDKQCDKHSKLLANTLEQLRADDVSKRHERGYRSDRVNLNDLIDAVSFVD